MKKFLGEANAPTRDAAAGDGGMRITGTDSEPIRKFGCKYTKFTMEKSENSDD